LTKPVIELLSNEVRICKGFISSLISWNATKVDKSYNFV